MGTDISEIQATSLNYSSEIQAQLNDVLASLASGVLIDAPSVSEPSTPDSPSIAGTPSAPNVQGLSFTAPEAPTAPELATATVPDVSTPTLTATAPELSFPIFDDITFPDAPGDAPTVTDIDIPADPDVTLPDVPELLDTDVPSIPGIVIPQFEGVRPTLPAMDTPGQVFAYQEGEFSNPLWTALRDQLADDLQNGGDVSAIAGMANLAVQDIAAVIDDRERKKEEIRNRYAAQGFATGCGPAEELMRLAERDADRDIQRIRWQTTSRQMELTVQSRQFTVQQALQAVVSVALDVFNQGANRALDAAKAGAQFAYQDVDARISLFNCQVSAFQAEATVMEARIRASLAVLEQSKQQLEAARIRGELNQQRVATYSAQIQAVGQIVEIFKARMTAVQVAADVQKSRLQAYETGVQAYAARVNATTAQYNAKVAQISGEKAKAEVYSEQVRAYSAAVEGAKTTAEIGSIRADIVAKHNASAVSLYQASTAAYQANWQGIIGQVDALVKNTANVIAAYDAQTRGATAENDARLRKFLGDTQVYQSRLQASVQEADMSLRWGESKARLNQASMQAIAQVLGSAISSALAQVHGSASDSNSTSKATSDVTATSTSTSTVDSTSKSTSNGYSESKNYNYTASV